MFLLGITQVLAEQSYVTDRISLDIHIGADEKTSVIKSVPSGTELEVLDEEGNFVEIRLRDGTQGWVNSGFVMIEIPAEKKYDVLATQYEKTTQELDKLKLDYTKKNRELQTRRDQLSNATTTIRDLKKRKDGKIIVDPEMENKLTASLQEIETLKLKLIKLEKNSESKVDIDQKQIFSELQDVKIQNDVMQKRIDVSMAHLSGKRIPTAEELASIRPQFPLWYWGLLIVLLLTGIVAGYFIMDYRYRSRHGGFRI